jgi:tRNA threonylcarbamoyladenosine biosynthesis protein TsaE
MNTPFDFMNTPYFFMNAVFSKMAVLFFFEMKEYIFTAHGLGDIAKIAAQIIEIAGARRKFVLQGEMGAGKTTLVAEICRQLGSIDTPASPTYAIVHTYQTDKNTAIHHVDLYRVPKLDENTYAELEGLLYDNFYSFIEWADILLNFLPPDHVVLEVATMADDTRRIAMRFAA